MFKSMAEGRSSVQNDALAKFTWLPFEVSLTNRENPALLNKLHVSEAHARSPDKAASKTQ